MTAAIGEAQRPRVLHVMDSLTVGGMEQVLLELIDRTCDRFDHSICCIRDLGERRRRFEAAGATITFIGKAEGQDWGVPWRIARVCRTIRPHIVHTRNWGTIEGVVTARLTRVPVVIHGEHGRDRVDDRAGDRRRDRIRRLVFPFVDRIVVVSQHLQRWLLEEIGVQTHKAALIPNGVDTDRFRPRSDRDRLRRERGYEPPQLLIGAVGRLQAIKDYPTLIAAFETVLRRHPEARLVIVGDGPERQSLADEIRRHHLQHAVQLAGQRDDVQDWLAVMDLFVQSSRMEASSNAIIEAMSVGLPVIATRTGGNPEVVQEDVTGSLIDAGDAAALAEAISFYCRTPGAREEHGRAGREKVMEHYPLARMVRAYTALYDDALRSRRVRVGAAARRAGF